MQHKGYNNIVSIQNGNSTAQKWKYNDTEYNDAFSLNMYEMPLRSYDPALARWTTIDPIVHYSNSTYNGFDNNPVFWADPSGGNSTTIMDVFYNAGSGESVFTNMGGNVFTMTSFTSSSEFPDMTGVVELPETSVTVRRRARGAGGGWDFSTFMDKIQRHTYTYSPYYNGNIAIQQAGFFSDAYSATDKHLNGSLGLIGVAVDGYNKIPNPLKRSYAYKMSKLTGIKSGDIYQGAKAFAGKTAKYANRLGKLGTAVTIGSIVYDAFDDGSLKASNGVNGALLAVGLMVPGAAPLLLAYGVADYLFDISGIIDNNIKEIPIPYYD